MSIQRSKNEINHIAVYKQKATQLSLVQTNRNRKKVTTRMDGGDQTEPSKNFETDHEGKKEPMSDDSEIETSLKKSTTTTLQSIMRDLIVLVRKKSKEQRSFSRRY